MRYEYVEDGKQSLLLKEKEAAQLLNISETKLKRLRYDGKIEFYQIGNRAYYSHKILDEFLASRLGGVK